MTEERKEIHRIHDEIQLLKLKKNYGGVDQSEQLQLDNLEEKLMQKWSDQHEF